MVIFIAMFVPSIRRVRGPAMRVQTHNNLKQCALAVHTYHDNFGRLPDGVSPGGQVAKDAPLWVHLLPFVEQAPLYSQFADGSPKLDAVIAPYLAPADEHATRSSGVVNFAANVRVFGHKTLEQNGQPVDVPGRAVETPAGTMLCDLKLGEIKDGTANVIMLSTRYSNCGGTTTWFYVDAYGHSEFGTPPSPGMGGFMGAGSSTTVPVGNAPVTAMFQLMPSVEKCRPDAGLFGHSFGIGGMSVALLDSSVRNISATMNPLTFAQALCPCDGQKFGPDWSEDD